MKLTQHKECVLVTCERTTITHFQHCSNIAWLTSHKRLASTLHCTQPHQRNQGATKNIAPGHMQRWKSLLDPCGANTSHWKKYSCVSIFSIISLACFKKPETQNHWIVDLNLRFRVRFFHFVVQLISLYYLMAMLFRVLSKESSVLIFRFEASSQTSGFV